MRGVARLPYVDPSDAPEPVREVLERVPPLNIFRMMANADTAFRPWIRWGAVLLSDLSLDAALRELAILRVARLTPHAEYEWVQHVPIAKAVGVRDAQVQALERDEPEADSFSPEERLVLRFTTEVVRTPAHRRRLRGIPHPVAARGRGAADGDRPVHDGRAGDGDHRDGARRAGGPGGARSV